MAKVSAAYQMSEASAAIPERRHQVVIEPTSQVPGPGTQAIQGGSVIEWLSLPTSSAAPGSFISTDESYLRIKVQLKTAAGKTGRLNKAGVVGLFQRLVVTSAGYTVSDENHANYIAATLQDLRMAREDRYGYAALRDGYFHSDDATETTTTLGAVFASGGEAATTTEEKEFCIPLPGQFWSSVKMLPTHAITDLAFRIHLANHADGVVSPATNGDTTGFQVTHCSLNLTYIEMSPSARSALASRAGTRWTASCWEALKDNLPAGVTSFQCRVPSAKSSVKGIMITARHKTLTVNSAAGNKGHDHDAMSRLYPDVAKYQFSCNGQLYPVGGPVEGRIQALAQYKRSAHDFKGTSLAITDANWGKSATAKYTDKYAIYETFENHGRSNQTISGISTLVSNPLCRLDFNAAIPVATGGYDLTYLVNYDCAWSVENGIVRASY